jgi:hypothetical protein
MSMDMGMDITPMDMSMDVSMDMPMDMPMGGMEGGGMAPPAAAPPASTDDDETDSSESEGMTAWEVLSVSSTGVLSWENSAFTKEIAGYEDVFDQDLDGDGTIGIDLSELDDVTTDTVGVQLKVSSTGSLYIWDGSDDSNLIAVTQENGGSPTFSVTHDWGDGSYVMAPYAVTTTPVKHKGRTSNVILSNSS